MLLGKALDFTLRFGEAPRSMPSAAGSSSTPRRRWSIARSARRAGARVRLRRRHASGRQGADPPRRRQARVERAWFEEARGAAERPARIVGALASEDAGQAASGRGVPHAEAACRAHPDTVLICDGGEFAQWGQSVLPVVPRRMINGVGGSIGSSLPMAGAARVVEPRRRCSWCWATERSASTWRSSRPRCAAICRSSRWSAPTRAGTRSTTSRCATTDPTARFGCELLPTRYDLVVAALGGHGELVQAPDELPGRSNDRWRAASRRAST